MPFGWMIGLLLPWCAAALVLRALMPRVWSSPWGRIFVLSLAAGMGLGAASCLFTLWLVVAGASTPAYLAFETAFFVIVGGIAIAARTRMAKPEAFGDFRREGAASGGRPLFRRLFVFVLILAAIVFVGLTLRRPHGEWDAWKIWNYRARFLHRGGTHWRDGFSPLLSDSVVDYPLLVPATVARLWRWGGGETVAAPACAAGLFALATAGLLAAALARRRGADAGWIAGILLLGTSPFLKEAAAQQADIPFGFFFLAAAVLLAEFHGDPRLSGKECIGTEDAEPGTSGSRAPLLLAGIASGCAAWTKNEGLPFLAIVPTAFVLGGLHRPECRRRLPAAVFPLLLGVLPLGLLLLYFKTRIAPPNNWVEASTPGEMLDKILTPGRYATIARGAAAHALHHAKGAMPALLLGWLLVCRPPMTGRADPAARSALLLVALQGAVYFGVYLVTPVPLAWHIDTSLDRLAVQLWPTALFASFLLFPIPDRPESARRIKPPLP